MEINPKSNRRRLLMTVSQEPIKADGNETRDIDLVVGYVSENTANSLLVGFASSEHHCS